MLHETPAVRVAINDAMAQLLLTNESPKKAEKASISDKSADGTADKALTPTPPSAPPETLPGPSTDTVKGPTPLAPAIIPQLTPEKRDNSNLNSATPSKTSTAKDGTGKDA